MKTFLWGFFVFGLAAVTAVSGYAHGSLSRRWASPEDYAPVVQKLVETPKEFGDWKMVEEQKLAPEVLTMLECMGNVYRTYQNMSTNERVTVAVILGPPGPISVHTPEICYPAKNYKIQGNRTKVVIRSAAGKEDALWTLDLRAKNVHGSGLKVYYGWRGGPNWDATEQPRFAYLGKSYLYKIQLAAESRDGDGAADDGCKKFLADLLPQLDRLASP